MKKAALLSLLVLLTATSCGQGGSLPPTTTSDPTTSVVETTSTEPEVQKTVEFAPMRLYKGFPLEIKPIFSHPEMASEENFTYTVKEEEFATIDGNIISYLTEGRTIVYAKSQNYETQFVLFTIEEFKTVGGPLELEYTRLKDRYDSHEQKENATIFIGDSFFQFWRDGTAGASFTKDFEGKNVVNLGINGTTTHHWRAIMADYLVKNVVSPKNFIVNIGINNVDDLSEDGKNGGKNVRMLLEDIHEAFPEANIYYFSVTRCSKGAFAKLWEHHDGINTYLKDNFFPNAPYTTYLDANEIFGEDYAKYRMDDGLHLNGRGYIIFKSLISEYVEIDDLD